MTRVPKIGNEAVQLPALPSSSRGSVSTWWSFAAALEGTDFFCWEEGAVAE